MPIDKRKDLSWRSSTYPPPSRNKGLIAGLIKGKPMVNKPSIRPCFWGGTLGGVAWPAIGIMHAGSCTMLINQLWSMGWSSKPSKTGFFWMFGHDFWYQLEIQSRQRGFHVLYLPQLPQLLAIWGWNPCGRESLQHALNLGIWVKYCNSLWITQIYLEYIRKARHSIPGYNIEVEHVPNRSNSREPTSHRKVSSIKCQVSCWQ